jgi:hypothetical protein
VTEKFRLLECDAVCLAITDVSEEFASSIFNVKNQRAWNNVSRNYHVDARYEETFLSC